MSSTASGNVSTGLTVIQRNGSRPFAQFQARCVPAASALGTPTLHGHVLLDVCLVEARQEGIDAMRPVRKRQHRLLAAAAPPRTDV